MAVANANEIEAVRPGPIADSVLTLQAQHRSDVLGYLPFKSYCMMLCMTLCLILYCDK